MAWTCCITLGWSSPISTAATSHPNQIRYPNQIWLGALHLIQNIDAIIELVAVGEGVSILPRCLLSEALGSRQLAVRLAR